MATTDLVQTGIAGLDTILLGGVPRPNIILVKGSVGSGKTLLGTEFIYRGITQFNEPGIIVIFESSPLKLSRDAALFGWDLGELQRQRKLEIIFTRPEVLDQELRSPDSLLLQIAADIGAQRIFIDGIGLLRQAPFHRGAASTSAPIGYRALLQQLTEGLSREHLTAMLSHELSDVPESQATLAVADFVVDTVIQLNRNRRERRSHRSVEIIKSRGQDFDAGEHTLRITPGRGLEVFRRVQAPWQPAMAQPTSTAKRSMIGVEALDALIGGGLFDGSTTMVAGISGAGKTVLGSQLLLEGALRQNTRGLLISLDEHPAQIVRNANTLGLDLEAQIDAGNIHILFESPQELDVDAHFARITRIVEEQNIQRLVIDGVTSYSAALRDQVVYRDFFHAIIAYSKSRLLTTFFNYENPEFLGISAYMPDFPVSSIVDNIVLLGLVEIGNSLRRSITVVKARGCQHEFDTREFVIGPGGIRLLPMAPPTQDSQPFQNYTSLLGRSPTRFPGVKQRQSGHS